MTSNNHCTVITYHYVRPIKQSKYPQIKGLELEDFTKQIQFLKSKFQFITIQQLLDNIYENKDIPTNSVLLTFDDGLKDHYTHVFPILRDFGIQGVFFPSAKPILFKSVLDVHKIHFILAMCVDVNLLINDIFELIRENKKDYDLEDPLLYFQRLAIPNRFDTKEIIFIKRILQKELPEELRSVIVEKLFLKHVAQNQEKFSQDLYLSLDEINEMMSSGMYFGSHGFSHEWLSFLTPEKLNIEIEKGKDFCNLIGVDKNYLTMCYPYGNYNESVIEELKKFQFKAAFSVIQNKTNLLKSNLFTLERFDTNDVKNFV